MRWIERASRRRRPSRRDAPRRRPAREVQPPSLRRTLKRALVFAPIMLATVYLLSPNLPLATKVTQTALIVADLRPLQLLPRRRVLPLVQEASRAQEQADGGRGS